MVGTHLEFSRACQEKIVQDLEMGKIILSILSAESWELSKVFSGDYLITLRHSPLTEFLLPKLFYNSVEAEFNL